MISSGRAQNSFKLTTARLSKLELLAEGRSTITTILLRGDDGNKCTASSACARKPRKVCPVPHTRYRAPHCNLASLLTRSWTITSGNAADLPIALHYVSDSQRTDDGLNYLTIAV